MERKKLQLNQKIESLTASPLPDWLHSATVFDLLCHRSGLSDYGHLPAYREALKAHPERPLSNREMTEMVFLQGSQGTPGTRFFYSNVGYGLLVEILEKTSSQNFESLLRTEILQPCGMAHTTVLNSLADMSSLVPGYSDFWSKPGRDVRSIYHPGWVLHRVLGSTVSDLNLFAAAVFNGTLLGPESLRLIRESYPLGFPHKLFQISYGPGFLGDPNSPIGMFLGNNGSGPGYSTSFFAHLDEAGKVSTVALMINRDGNNICEELAYRLLTLLTL